ncbi:DUF1294 domain-containing protein [Citroniella saccharovorans]|uniref:DUF1294 domain-containing protein n=1 Tax=Citroniella saccharovorans TaxID=2053367 RepID=A0AAW9MTF4_9FIRM|nr:DUF1294 domain-containing protein [Citroniella saccharovorans]MEB3429346.1 DUF1294 domain-containing protein [Citroniella saccharovorans]
MNDFEYLLNSEIGLVLFAINIMLFLVYGYDKFKSKINGWRVSEKFLLSLGLFGGGFGGILGMLAFRHKTKKTYFYIVNFIGIGIFFWILNNL